MKEAIKRSATENSYFDAKISVSDLTLFNSLTQRG